MLDAMVWFCRAGWGFPFVVLHEKWERVYRRVLVLPWDGTSENEHEAMLTEEPASMVRCLVWLSTSDQEDTARSVVSLYCFYEGCRDFQLCHFHNDSLHYDTFWPRLPGLTGCSSLRSTS
jgi:hypothetical protein